MAKLLKVEQRKAKADRDDTHQRRTWLRFNDGRVVDYVNGCPKQILASGHWRLSEGDVAPGEPNTVCACAERASEV